MTLASGQRALAADVVAATTKTIKRGLRLTDSTATATIVGVLRLDAVPVTAGRLYRVCTGPLHLDSTVVDDHIEARITYTTDGTNAGTGSSTLPGARTQGRQSANAAYGETRSIEVLYVPSTDHNLSILLCVRRDTGSGNVSITGTSDFAISMWVEDAGADPGNSGTSI